MSATCIYRDNVKRKVEMQFYTDVFIFIVYIIMNDYNSVFNSVVALHNYKSVL